MVLWENIGAIPAPISRNSAAAVELSDVFIIEAMLPENLGSVLRICPPMLVCPA
jgi:hypothetical protein